MVFEIIQIILSFLSIVILAITAIIVYKYTKETHKLRKTAERQLEAMFRPHLHPVESCGGGLCKFVNCGKGPALDLHIIGFSKESPEKECKLGTKDILVIRVDEHREISLPDIKDENHLFFIFYKSISNTVYVTILGKSKENPTLQTIGYYDYETLKQKKEYERFVKVCENKLLEYKL